MFTDGSSEPLIVSLLPLHIDEHCLQTLTDGLFYILELILGTGHEVHKLIIVPLCKDLFGKWRQKFRHRF